MTELVMYRSPGERAYNASLASHPEPTILWRSLSEDEQDKWIVIADAVLDGQLDVQAFNEMFASVKRLETWVNEDARPKLEPLIEEGQTLLAKIKASPMLRMLGVK